MLIVLVRKGGTGYDKSGTFNFQLDEAVSAYHFHKNHHVDHNQYGEQEEFVCLKSNNSSISSVYNRH